MTVFSYGQSKQAWVNSADSAYARRDFYSAFKYYEAALKYDDSRIDIWYRYAESALEFKAFPYALSAYEQVLNSPDKNNYPLTALRMAGVFMFSLATLCHRTGAMPRVFVWATWTLAALLVLGLTQTLWAALLFPAWVLGFSLYLLLRPGPAQA